MDLEKVRAAADNVNNGILIAEEIDALARFAAALLSTEPTQDGENDVIVTAEQFARLLDPPTRGQLAALRLALGLPLTVGGDS